MAYCRHKQRLLHRATSSVRIGGGLVACTLVHHIGQSDKADLLKCRELLLFLSRDGTRRDGARRGKRATTSVLMAPQ